MRCPSCATENEPGRKFCHECGTRLVAGGFQPVEAYDVLVANLDPTLDRKPPPETPEPLLHHFRGGVTTQEVAALMTPNNGTPNREAA